VFINNSLIDLFFRKRL